MFLTMCIIRGNTCEGSEDSARYEVSYENEEGYNPTVACDLRDQVVKLARDDAAELAAIADEIDEQIEELEEE